MITLESALLILPLILRVILESETVINTMVDKNLLNLLSSSICFASTEESYSTSLSRSHEITSAAFVTHTHTGSLR